MKLLLFTLIIVIFPFKTITIEQRAYKKANDIIRRKGTITMNQLDSINNWYMQEKRKDRIIPKF